MTSTELLMVIGIPGLMYAGLLTFIFWIFLDDEPGDEEDSQ